MSIYLEMPQWAETVSHETLKLLSAYAELLLKWNQKINLVGKTTEHEIWHRHIWDSYQLVDLVPRETKTLADLGSGGGLPGLVIACAQPELRISLVERDTRKCAFLREAARSLGLRHVEILHEDARNLNQTFEIVTARALAPLSELLELVAPLMGKDAICFFPKGENFAREITDARVGWSFDHQVIPSKTLEKAGIVSVSKLKRAGGLGSI